MYAPTRGGNRGGWD